MRLKKSSYRFAEQVLNGKLALKQEIENILTDPSIDVSSLSRPHFNKVLRERFVACMHAGSLSFNKVVRYLPHFKSAIQLPIYVIGIDL